MLLTASFPTKIPFFHAFPFSLTFGNGFAKTRLPHGAKIPLYSRTVVSLGWMIEARKDRFPTADESAKVFPIQVNLQAVVLYILKKCLNNNRPKTAFQAWCHGGGTSWFHESFEGSNSFAKLLDPLESLIKLVRKLL